MNEERLIKVIANLVCMLAICFGVMISIMIGGVK